MSEFTHFDESGRPRMVDVTDKVDTDREAIAMAIVRMEPETRALIESAEIQKGDVIQVAELAGIMAAKRTSDLIPLCHPIPLSKVTLVCSWNESSSKAELRLTATVKTHYRTGVEMEALTAVTTAALTVYDMCKAVDKGMTIEHVCLMRKSGGKSGLYERVDPS